MLSVRFERRTREWWLKLQDDQQESLTKFDHGTPSGSIPISPLAGWTLKKQAAINFRNVAKHPVGAMGTS
jgi:hypothetical protein